MCMQKRMQGETVLEWALRVNLTPNENKAHCVGHKDNGEICGEELPAGSGLAVVLPWAGDRPRYVCPTCLNRMLSYHGNAERNRTGLCAPKKGDLENTTIGCELEIMNRVRNAYITLKVMIEKNLNVIEEHDGSVDGEYPTDYMHGCNKISKNVRKIEKYGFLPCFNNSRCGAHIHVEIKEIEIIRNWYNTLFTPMSNVLKSKGSEWLITNFGRDFSDGWSDPITPTTSCDNKYTLVNTKHSNTLELRLPRFASAEQYMADVYFWREVGYYLNNVEWIAKVDGNRAERKAQAEYIGQQLVEILKSHFEI